MKTNNENYYEDCIRMNRGVRTYLANQFPDTSIDIALLVLLRIATSTAVDSVGRQNAPAAISRLVNHFLTMDHDNE
jgi:hypothetical protein